MKKLTLRIFSILLFVSIPLLAREKYNPAVNKDVGFDNQYIKVSILSVNRNGASDRLTLSLKIVNVSGKDQYIAFYNDNLSLSGDDGVNDSNINVSGIPVLNRYQYANSNNYVLLPGGKNTIVNLAVFFNREKSEADSYNLTSNFLVFNSDDPQKPLRFTAGLSNIRLK